jgi:hypothetical protein
LPDAVVDGKIDRRRGQCYVERYAIVLRGKRLQ